MSWPRASDTTSNHQEYREALVGRVYISMNSKNNTGIGTVMRGGTSYTTAGVYQQSGESVDCKTCAGTSNENEPFMGPSSNTCVRAGCGLCSPPGSYHDTALLLSRLTQQRHGGGLECFRGIEMFVAWADLADTRLLHPLCLAGIYNLS